MTLINPSSLSSLMLAKPLSHRESSRQDPHLTKFQHGDPTTSSHLKNLTLSFLPKALPSYLTLPLNRCTSNVPLPATALPTAGSAPFSRIRLLPRSSHSSTSKASPGSCVRSCTPSPPLQPPQTLLAQPLLHWNCPLPQSTKSTTPLSSTASGAPNSNFSSPSPPPAQQP